MMGKIGAKKNRGPMGRAFFTRNPLLPREYFVPKGVDDFVAKMNQGVEHSLLDCPGRYTVQVATFRGKTVLQTDRTSNRNGRKGLRLGLGKAEGRSARRSGRERAPADEELRKNGWEAYEFHDRTESIVTIGSFEQVGQQLANGQIVPIGPQCRRSSRPLALRTTRRPIRFTIGNDIGTQRRVEDMKQQFNQVLASHNGQIAAGLNPKHVKIMHGKKVERIIPIDIYPHTIEVPKRSVSSAYAEETRNREFRSRDSGRVLTRLALNPDSCILNPR